MIFSREQTEAIEHVSGPMMVIAGPGSGKTTVIVYRIKNLIESAGASPADILVITFTKAAAAEMKQRFGSITGDKEYSVRFGTFHSVFFWIIKTAYRLSNDCVMTEAEKRELLVKLMKEYDIDVMDYGAREEVLSSVLSQISTVKCDMLDIDSYYSHDMPEEEFRQLYKHMDAYMKQHGRIDFDDMQVMCYELLRDRRDILESCRKLFKYVLVDEFQDCNRIQYEILKLLTGVDGNVFVVGDDDQSVYGFRGARPEIMKQFTKDYRNTKRVMLGVNYRCDRSITDAAATLISNNTMRFSKDIRSEKKETGAVKLAMPRDIAEENDTIVDLIRKNLENGVPYERQAVIYRTNRQPRRLAYRLNQFNIPYNLSDVLPNMFDHFVIRNVLDYMRLAMGDYSRETFLRIMNKPTRYISRDSLVHERVDLRELRAYYRDKSYVEENIDKLIYDLDMLKKLRPYPAVCFIRNAMGDEDYLKKYAEEKNLDYEELADILDEAAYLFMDLQSYGEVFSFIDGYVKEQKDSIKSGKKEGVNLLTMHSAKGLEFDCVYILDAVEGYCPYKKARTPAEREEERRMFYVAMTRAIHRLYIFSPKTIAGKDKKISRFIGEACRR